MKIINQTDLDLGEVRLSKRKEGGKGKEKKEEKRKERSQEKKR